MLNPSQNIRKFLRTKCSSSSFFDVLHPLSQNMTDRNFLTYIASVYLRRTRFKRKHTLLVSYCFEFHRCQPSDHSSSSLTGLRFSAWKGSWFQLSSWNDFGISSSWFQQSAAVGSSSANSSLSGRAQPW